jgi:hypothetical protein
MPLPPS